jgi:capsular exopolysaccharide synthesis family protein
MRIVTNRIEPLVLASQARDDTTAVGAESALRQYLRIVLRRRWVLAGIITGAFALGLVLTFLMTPKYTASSTIEISREADQVTNFEGVERDVSIADQEFYQTQYGLLRSRSLAERVAAELRLIDDPAFFRLFNALDEDAPAFQQANGRFAPQGRDERRRTAGEVLLKNLAVEPTRLSRLVEIKFTSPEPELSMRVANAWSENFIESNLERKIQSTSYGRKVLQGQLAEYKERLDESQRQLVAYASSQQIINLPAQSGSGGTTQERSIVADELAALNAALSQSTADRIEAEARFRQAGPSGGTSEALANSAINNLRQRRAELAAEYQQLMVRFEPGYPAAQAIAEQIEDLDRSISREEGRVSSSLRADYRQAVQRENALQAQVDRLKGEFLDLRRRSIQYNIFQQEVDTNRALYDGLLQRFKEIGVAGGIAVNNVSIIDEAEIPLEPSSPRLLLNLALALLAGLILGVAVALGLEQLDERISDPGDLRRQLGLPFLGSVPPVLDMEPVEALRDRKSEVVDAYLAVQTNLGFSTEHGVPRSFSVTSSRPAEGKSTTALALATTLSRAGRRVVLVDGDMRSPSVHHLGGVQNVRGLSNYLAGEEDVGSLTFGIESLGFTAMCAGPPPPNAAELLIGDRLALLLEKLLADYDHVIVDSPPVLGLADAPLIARQAEGVVYVIEANGVGSAQASNALQRLHAAGCKVFGGVLTKFDARKAQYEYNYGYGYGTNAQTT